MGSQPPADDSSHSLLAGNGEKALGELFEQYRDRLRAAVTVRMDPQLRGRIDASDVIQEAFVEAQRRLPEYQREARMPPFVWIRYLTMQRLLILHRRHVDAAQRDARREVPIAVASGPGVSSFHLASLILDSQDTPSDVAQRDERGHQLEQALDEMRPDDRDVLVLRHFEHLTTEEAADVLGVSVAAASRRYYRALKRLKQVLNNLLEG